MFLKLKKDVKERNLEANNVAHIESSKEKFRRCQQFFEMVSNRDKIKKSGELVKFRKKSPERVQKFKKNISDFECENSIFLEPPQSCSTPNETLNSKSSTLTVENLKNKRHLHITSDHANNIPQNVNVPFSSKIEEINDMNMFSLTNAYCLLDKKNSNIFDSHFESNSLQQNTPSQLFQTSPLINPRPLNKMQVKELSYKLHPSNKLNINQAKMHKAPTQQQKMTDLFQTKFLKPNPFRMVHCDPLKPYIDFISSLDRPCMTHLFPLKSDPIIFDSLNPIVSKLIRKKYYSLI